VIPVQDNIEKSPLSPGKAYLYASPPSKPERLLVPDKPTFEAAQTSDRLG
jgi:hypothetical protein